jgi:hypothetical protein
MTFEKRYGDSGLKHLNLRGTVMNLPNNLSNPLQKLPFNKPL